MAGDSGKMVGANKKKVFAGNCERKRTGFALPGGVAAACVLLIGLVLLAPSPVLAKPSNGSSCTGCHSTLLTGAGVAITTYVNGAAFSPATQTVDVGPNTAFEVDWFCTNTTRSASNDGGGLFVGVPSGFGVSVTNAANPFSGNDGNWNNAVGVGGYNIGPVAVGGTEPPSADGIVSAYSIDFDAASSSYSTGSSGSVFDNGIGADPDGVADRLGSDVTLTSPGVDGAYKVWVACIGHTLSGGGKGTKGYLAAVITVNVSSGGNTQPVNPANAAQYRSDGSTVISDGGETNETTVKIGADLSDPDLDTVKLQVDLNGDSASDCESALVASGTTNAQASCTVVVGNSYDWQVRAVDSIGAASAWVPYAGSPDFSVDTTAPAVTTTTPANSSVDVPVNQNVTINWNDTVDCSTVTTATITSTSPTWNLSSCSGSQAVFATGGQAGSTTYSVTVSTAVKDGAGNPMASSYVFSWETTKPPTVTSTVPTNGATGIALNAQVTINWSEPVNCATVNTFNITSTSPTWTLNGCSGSQATFNTGGQANNAPYTVTVGTSVQDANGVSMAASFPFSYTTTAAANNPPNAPVDHTQYKADGTTAILAGKMTNETTVVIKGTVSDPDSNDTELQIEIIDNGTGFSGTPNCTSGFVTSGTSATATCSGLGDPSTLKWQARTFDGLAYSAWQSFGAGDPDVLVDSRMDFGVDTAGNTAPDVPTDHDQYRSDTTTLINAGGYHNETTVVIKATVSDPEAGSVQLQVEIVADAASYSGTPNCTSAFVPSGTVATATCSGLVDGTAYKWQMRASDGSLQSVWAAFGNPPPDPDFTVDVTAPNTTDDYPGGWETANVTVTLNATDGVSGVASTVYCVDTTDTCLPSTAGTSIGVSCGAGAACIQYVRYYSTDNAGNAEATNSTLTPIDKALPFTTDDAPAGWQTSDVTVTLSPSDVGSGVAGTLYCVDTTNTCTPTTPGTSVSVTQAAGTAGTQYVRYATDDVAGNTESVKSAVVQIDKTAPVTTDDYAGGWINTDVTVTLAPTDTGGGIAGTFYCVDTTNTCSPVTSGTSVSVTCLAGSVCNQYVRYYSSDNAGNTETVNSTLTRIDKSPPITSDNAPLGWQTSDVTVTLSAGDAGSGVAGTFYCVDTTNSCVPATPGTIVTVTQLAGTAGTQYVRYYSTDAAGNSETVNSATVQIDRAVPVTTDDAPAGWQTADVTVTLFPSDVGSGLAGTSYCQDATNSCVPATSGTTVTVTQAAGTAGTHYVRYYSTDVAGNAETVKSATVQIDKSAPVTTDNYGGGWFATDQTVTLSPTDTGSGVAGTQYCLDTANSCSPSTSGTSVGITCLAGQECSQYLRYRSTDNVGNTEATKSTPTGIDKKAPVTTDNYPGGIQAGNIVVTLTPTDGGSGVADTLYCVDTANSCAPALTGTSVAVTCPLGSTCDQYVRYYSTDAVGNGEATKSTLTQIDRTGLQVTSSVPADGAVGIVPDSSITITWNKDVDCGTVTEGVTVHINNGAVLSRTSCGANQAVFSVSSQINNTLYVITVTTGVQDLGANSQIVETLISYRTEVRPTPYFAQTECSDCHGIPAWDATGGRGVPEMAVVGSHEIPYHTKGNCTDCHVDNTGGGLGHRNGLIEMVTKVGGDIHGQLGSFYDKNGNLTYDPGAMPSDDEFAQSNSPVLGSCEATACHGDWGSPTWGTLSGTGQCYVCHGDPVNGNNAPVADAHQSHFQSTWTRPDLFVDCSNCHDTPPYVDTTGADGHLDGSPAELIPGVGWTSPTCNTVWCHNTGIPGATDATPNWNTSTSSCGMCHGNPPNAANFNHGTVTPGSCFGDASSCHPHNGAGNPPEHMDGGVDVVLPTECNDCHGNPPTSGAHAKHATVTVQTVAEDRTDCANCHTGADTYTVTKAGTHMNGGVDVAGAGYNSGSGACASACHVSSAGDGYWTDPNGLNCDACHGGRVGDGTVIASGNHTKHVSGKGYDCDVCHGVVPTDTTHITDRSGASEGAVYTGMAQALQDEAALAIGTDPDPGNPTCNNAACHNPSPGASYSATWNVSTATCTLCHNNTDPGTGSHTEHVTAATTFGRNAVCTDCHVDNGVNTGHTNGTVDVTGTKIVSWTDPTCTATCHSDGVAASGSSPNWGTSSPDCTICHAYPPGTNRHGLHIGNTNYVSGCADCHTGATSANHMNGTKNLGGLITAGNASNCTQSCHNNASWFAGTLVCNDCHQDSPVDYIGPVPSSGLHVQNGSFPAVMGHDDNFGAGYTCDGATGCHDTANPTNRHKGGTMDAPNVATYTFNATGKTINLNVLADATDDTCTATCHSDNNQWQRLWSSAAYSTATAVGSARCNVCHGQYASLPGSLGWRTGTSHQGTQGGASSTRGASHNGVGGNSNACEDCHVYPTATTNHENGFITMNNAGSVSESGGRAWCSACHSNDGAPTTGGTHTFTQSDFPLQQVAGPNDPQGDCLACHQAGAGYVAANGGGGAQVTQLEVYPHEFDGTTNAYGAHRINGGPAVTPHSNKINANTDLFVTNSWMGAVSKDTALECTDCHDTSNTGADGNTHMGTVDRNLTDYTFLLRTLDTTVTRSGQNALMGTTNASLSPTHDANFCFNCHRADVYVDGAANTTLSAFDHVANGNDDDQTKVVTGIYCQHCHAAGIRSNGAHSSGNATWGLGTAGSTGFMNGASWTQSYNGTCYTTTTNGGASSWSSCSRGSHN